MEGHDRNGAGQAGQRDAQRGLPAAPGVGANSRRRNSQMGMVIQREMAGVAVTNVQILWISRPAWPRGLAGDRHHGDAPTRKLSSGSSTCTRTGKRCASRTQSRLRGTLGKPIALPSSGNHGPRETDDFAREPLPFELQINLRRSPFLDMLELRFAKIGDDIPSSRVHQSEQSPPLPAQTRPGRC